MCSIWVEINKGKVIDGRYRDYKKGHYVFCSECGVIKIKDKKKGRK